MFKRWFDHVRLVILRFHHVLSISVQLALVVVANRLAFLLRFDGAPPAWADEAFVRMLPWLLIIRGVIFVPFRLYAGLWRYTSIYDLNALAGGVLASSLAFWCLAQTALGPPVYPRSIFIIDALLLTLLLGGIRTARRVQAEFSRTRSGKRVLIFGAGDAGELIVRDMKMKSWYGYEPIGFIDDDAMKVGRRIHGVPVLGTRSEAATILAKHRPHEVLIAIPSADPAEVRSIVRSLEPFKIPIKTLPNMHDIIDGRVEVARIRSLSVEDLIARTPIGLDPRPLRHLIQGRRVMVTGAGGSIGSELCRQIAALMPASLVMLDRYENTLHAIRLELQDARPSGTALHAVIGDVTDRQAVSSVLRRHEPELIFHAAAHKHVPLMEENPCEAVKNNVRGTRILAQAAQRHGVRHFVLISTDKAVNPTSVMGASKRIAELIVQAQAEGSRTSYSIVRFGNVLASNGSIVPRFLDQIRKGGPITVTHPEMRRFFMLIPEAVQLVLHAAAQAQSGATYVLDMGNPVKVSDMARDLVRLSGLVPDEDIHIVFTGIRPGEKLDEELVGPEEEVRPSAVESILCVMRRTPPPAQLFEDIAELEKAAVDGNTTAVVSLLRRLAPTFSTAQAAPTEVLQSHTETIGAAVGAT